MYRIIQYNSLGCELDRYEAEYPGELLEEMARRGSIDGGDTFKVVDLTGDAEAERVVREG